MMGQQRISDILFVMIVYVGYLYYNHDTMSNNAIRVVCSEEYRQRSRGNHLKGLLS